ncbi:MAG: 2-C-methyl-D-erythritol 4-phosphate cytidylyltransferase [Candidatus Riflebacteria bacterium]|nr:2-C-methyl-D-erythritol 4-phosphate cytidylyltransferase [Candidatus Riflebacteria bacterium]
MLMGEPMSWAVVVAAGSGRRMGSALPKQFLTVNRRSILAHCLRALLSHPAVLGAVVALPRGYVRYTREKILARERLGKPVVLVVGGPERSESVVRALRLVPPDVSHVIIHDGVRPCVPHALIDRLLDGAFRWGAAIPGLRATDTLKEIGPDRSVVRTLERDQVVAVQTPQAFRRELIERAYARIDRRRHTDCSSALEAVGVPVRVVEGAAENIKVTTPIDLAVLGALLGSRDPRPAAGAVRRRRT